MAAARNDDNHSKRGKGKKPWKTNSGGVRSSKWGSVHKSTNHSNAECPKQKEEKRNLLLLLPKPTSHTWVPVFYLRIPVRRTLRSASRSPLANSSSGPGRAAPPAGTAAPAVPEPSLLPGTAVATPLQEEDSPCGLFGAFGVSLSLIHI